MQIPNLLRMTMIELEGLAGKVPVNTSISDFNPDATSASRSLTSAAKKSEEHPRSRVVNINPLIPALPGSRHPTARTLIRSYRQLMPRPVIDHRVFRISGIDPAASPLGPRHSLPSPTNSSDQSVQPLVISISSGRLQSILTISQVLHHLQILPTDDNR